MCVLLPDMVRWGLRSFIVLWSPGLLWPPCCPATAFLVVLSCFYFGVLLVVFLYFCFYIFFHAFYFLSLMQFAHALNRHDSKADQTLF